MSDIGVRLALARYKVPVSPSQGSVGTIVTKPIDEDDATSVASSAATVDSRLDVLDRMKAIRELGASAEQQMRLMDALHAAASVPRSARSIASSASRKKKPRASAPSNVEDDVPNDVANFEKLDTVDEEMQGVVNETKRTLTALYVTTSTLLPPPGDRISV